MGDFNLLLEDNDIKEEELVEKVKIVSTDESSGEEEEGERRKVEEIGKGEVVGEAKALVMTQKQDARDNTKEGDAALEVTPPKCPPANEGQVAVGESKNESKSGSTKDPFDELFEELDDGEIEAEEGFQEIFGQGGAEAVTAAVDTPTPRVLETSREEAEEARQESFGKMEGEQEA